MNKDSCYAFYGSLRKGMYNYIRFQDHLTYLSTEILPGFKLHALEHYPFAVKSSNPSDRITVEIMRITDPKIESAIHHLELTAGYFYEELVLRGLSVGIYLFSDSQDYPHVRGGDWIEFLRQNHGNGIK